MTRAVQLKVYDLSGGLAKSLSLGLIGKEIEGIWHTGVVVGGIEYFFGQGIQQCQQHLSPFGSPHQTLCIGNTEIPDEMIHDFIEDVMPRFNVATYDLLSNNCNTFSDALCDFLVGKGIPEYILGLPQEVMDAPGGQALLQLVQPMMQQRFSSATASGFAQAPPSRPNTQAMPRAASELASAPEERAAPCHSHRSPESSQHPAPLPTDSSTEPTNSGKEEFQAAINREFYNARMQGIQDANSAAAAAIRRVAELVQSGTVMPPQAQSNGCVPTMAKE